MISDTSHLFRQLKLAFCPNREWEKKGAVGQEEETWRKRRRVGWGVGDWQTSESVSRELRTVLGNGRALSGVSG